ncbi:structural protein [Cellulophaga phage phi4:1]|uniref:Structural protein n=5 Tax=Lightbulbvirus TaxID=1918522 RepID=A0A0S2MWG4_9CAUD|nr:structural protein [Cellulophaga phage phi4:1]YP_008241552.1 structural protein [Cellulophaga phage phi17:2]ALO80064.1 structural protein [Cellulophaga phage phi4:1_13]ALO80261.1 structural protein [Cellulophaga phage phi4:1_18]ALO80460.1 structural protein [Cellulophaga phage phi17:2_18]AGO47590.1 structural protein [Cellulophaga phage phi17:2]AGO49468.1 structural protein [Cellulophaga phage phi4:1]
MSSQSIKSKNICDLQYKYNTLVIRDANKYLLKTKFDVGAFNLDKIGHNLKVLSLLYSKACDNKSKLKEVYIDELVPKDKEQDCTCRIEPKSCIPCKKTII